MRNVGVSVDKRAYRKETMRSSKGVKNNKGLRGICKEKEYEFYCDKILFCDEYEDREEDVEMYEFSVLDELELLLRDKEYYCDVDIDVLDWRDEYFKATVSISIIDDFDEDALIELMRMQGYQRIE